MHMGRSLGVGIDGVTGGDWHVICMVRCWESLSPTSRTRGVSTDQRIRTNNRYSIRID
jgi:hypothetical protein